MDCANSNKVEGETRPSSARAWAIVCGMAALLALWFSLFHRSSPFVALLGDATCEDFVLGVCVGGLLCGAAAALLCAKDPYRPLALGNAKPALLYGLLGAGAALLLAGVAAMTAIADAGGAQALTICGALAGAGLCLLAVALFDAAARRGVRGLVLCGAQALVLFALLHVPLVLLQGWGAAAYCAVMTLALLAAVVLASKGPAAEPPAESSAPSRETTIPERLSASFRSTWRLLVVTLVCAYIIGFNWNPLRTGLFSTARALLVAEESVAALLAAALFFALWRLCTDENLLVRLQRVIVPIAVATFVIIPYFTIEETGVAFYEFVAVVRQTCIFLFVVGLTVSLALASRVANASQFFMAGSSLALSALCMLVGFAVASAFGAAANAVGAVLFVGYLIVALALLSVGREGEQKAQAIEKRLFDEYLRQRCAEMAGEYGLSPRESEMLVHLGRGHGYVYIAELTFVAESTVRAHAKSIFKKCGVSSREELIDLIDRDPQKE